MSITLHAQHDRFPLIRPFRIARGTKTVADVVTVTIGDSDAIGRGEAAGALELQSGERRGAGPRGAGGAARRIVAPRATLHQHGIPRRVVRAAWLGLDPGDLSALDDPTTIEAIRRAGPTGAGR